MSGASTARQAKAPLMLNAFSMTSVGHMDCRARKNKDVPWRRDSGVVMQALRLSSHQAPQ